MNSDTEKAKRGLENLPPSAEKNDALRLLEEIEREDAEQKILLENLERAIAKCQGTESEKRLFRWLPWFSVLLGCIATYDGITAILTKEFCYLSRDSQICNFGPRAQIHGILVLLAGVFLFSLALPEGRWRTIGLWAVGLILFSSLLWALLGG